MSKKIFLLFFYELNNLKVGVKKRLIAKIMIKSHLNKGISTPLAIGVILVLVILVGSLTLWQYSKIRKEETQLPESRKEETQLPERKIPEQEEVKDETADWEIYRNKEYGYEFKYPSNTKIEDGNIYSAEHSLIFYIGNSNVNIAIYTQADFSTEIDKFIYEELIKLNKNFEAYQEDHSRKNKGRGGPAGPLYYFLLKTKVDEVPAIDFPNASPGGVGRSIYILKNDKVIEIFHNKSYIFASEDEKMGLEYKDFEKFLSTFKFID